VQRNKSRLSKLRLTNGQHALLQIDIGTIKADWLADPHARGGQKPKQS
jgi:hypothetical protein